jgi:hypothetical protein
MRRIICADSSSKVVLSCCVVPLLRCKTPLGATVWWICMRVGSDTAASGSQSVRLPTACWVQRDSRTPRSNVLDSVLRHNCVLVRDFHLGPVGVQRSMSLINKTKTWIMKSEHISVNVCTSRCAVRCALDSAERADGEQGGTQQTNELKWNEAGESIERASREGQ